MNIVDTFPHKIETLHHVTIPMPDGAMLAARIWRPVSALTTPVPAVLEYIPYRQRDGTAARDAQHHPYFAGHGYAAVRVDLRGSGDSQGVMHDEYSEQELADGEAVIAWLADQPWCNGRVGMIGISWGGFNGLQLAARQPPNLAAVITVCSTDDRYADDVHYMGGCLLGDNLSWASTMFAYNARPPDPDTVGADWRDMWLERLEHSGLWLDTWLRHPHRDDYWRHGSICEDFAAVRVPVLAASGWADGYSNAVFRLLEHLDVPRLGLIGPWSHKYPHLGVPGPAVGFLQEAVRWWDRWLTSPTEPAEDIAYTPTSDPPADISVSTPDDPPADLLTDTLDDPLDNTPMLRVFMQDSTSPFTSYTERPGRWVAEARYPSPRINTLTFQLAEGRLWQRPDPDVLDPDVLDPDVLDPDVLGAGVSDVDSQDTDVARQSTKQSDARQSDAKQSDADQRDAEQDAAAEPLTITSPLSVGLYAGKWCSYAGAPDLPADQRLEDGGSLVFDTPPLVTPIEICGIPSVHLEVAVDKPVAMVAARLSEVLADGKVTRVTYGLLNLTHRDSHSHPEPLEPHSRYRVTVQLNGVAQHFSAGSRIRLALSTSYFPLAWPAPEPVRLKVYAASSQLHLPLRPPHSDDKVSFADPEAAPPLAVSQLEPGESAWRVHRDLAEDRSQLEVIDDKGRYRLDDIGTVLTSRAVETYSITGDDVSSARGETLWQQTFERGDWHARIVTKTVLSCDADYFYLHAQCDAYERDTRIFAKNWTTHIPRDLL